ncbi:hypothetical protein I8752_14035 [Nostocaceae cyanobacterium CENA369]|uniref:Uncharacterized protein n=1 Tax=Dendronalium phyllosphericum CENA369 TaxID=1725256 RepID=A0A8J7LHK6_9NOST|nr:hypothetical protein [Dendronalium phyllosphericum]MBH8574119.1 hypothetical protein [Dendronalium phyllosphericum CENA369]
MSYELLIINWSQRGVPYYTFMGFGGGTPLRYWILGKSFLKFGGRSKPPP